MIIAEIAVGVFLAFAGFSATKDDTACTNFWCTCAIISALASMTC